MSTPFASFAHTVATSDKWTVRVPTGRKAMLEC